MSSASVRWYTAPAYGMPVGHRPKTHTRLDADSLDAVKQAAALSLASRGGAEGQLVLSPFVELGGSQREDIDVVPSPL